jgi:hypothetical protein
VFSSLSLVDASSLNNHAYALTHFSVASALRSSSDTSGWISFTLLENAFRTFDRLLVLLFAASSSSSSSSSVVIPNVCSGVDALKISSITIREVVPLSSSQSSLARGGPAVKTARFFLVPRHRLLVVVVVVEDGVEQYLQVTSVIFSRENS